MLLAETVYCQAAGTGFYVGVELDQILDGLGSLARSLEEFSQGAFSDEEVLARK
jgi:hypothetical protein